MKHLEIIFGSLIILLAGIPQGCSEVMTMDLVDPHGSQTVMSGNPPQNNIMSQVYDKQRENSGFPDNANLNQNRQKRSIYNYHLHPEKKWSLPIKYNIDSVFDTHQKEIIRTAIQYWENETCVRFVEIKSWETSITEQYVHFKHKFLGGCYTYMAKADLQDVLGYETQRQPIVLSDDCFDQIGSTVHEIGHVLGLYHEMSRMDRDQAVDINIMNIFWLDIRQFEKPDDPTTIDNEGVPYDLGSVMQYPADADGDTNTSLTIIPKEVGKLSVLGQRSEISFYDAKLVNLAYCPVADKLPCVNGGYTDSNDVTRCKCPDGWGGKFCGQIKHGVKGCSPAKTTIRHHKKHLGKVFSLFSPNYRHKVSNTFQPGDECYWQIKVPKQYSIDWWIGQDRNHNADGGYFGLYKWKTACQFWLEIKTPQEVRGVRVCGYLDDPDDDFTKPHVTNQSELHINFRSFTTVYKSFSDNYLRGFHLKYRSAFKTPNEPVGNVTLISQGVEVLHNSSTTARTEVTSSLTVGSPESNTAAISSTTLPPESEDSTMTDLQSTQPDESSPDMTISKKIKVKVVTQKAPEGKVDQNMTPLSTNTKNEEMVPSGTTVMELESPLMSWFGSLLITLGVISVVFGVSIYVCCIKGFCQRSTKCDVPYERLVRKNVTLRLVDGVKLVHLLSTNDQLENKHV